MGSRMVALFRIYGASYLTFPSEEQLVSDLYMAFKGFT